MEPRRARDFPVASPQGIADEEAWHQHPVEDEQEAAPDVGEFPAGISEFPPREEIQREIPSGDAHGEEEEGEGTNTGSRLGRRGFGYPSQSSTQ